MPKLNKINCAIELGPSNTKLKEYGTRYSDGYVETFIAVPNTDLPFSIHLNSEGYIAPGLAFFVFIDGEYQCNRNRTDLKLPSEGVLPHECETEFRVRQKEEKTSAGTFVVRDWTFAKMNRVAADKAPNLNPQFTSNVGTIEIIVLRCKAAFEEHPSPQRYQFKTKKAPAYHKAESNHSLPPEKPASGFQSELGGLFGLFDGACDEVDLFISDEHSDPNSQNEPLEQFGALDGAGDPPGVVINQYSTRLRDGVHGYNYLGPQSDSRDAHKKYWQSLYNQQGATQQPLCQSAAAARYANTAEDATEEARLTALLGGMRNKLEDFLLGNEENSRADLDEPKNDLRIVRELLAGLQGLGGLQRFPAFMRDVLKDVEIMRQYTESLQKHYTNLDFKTALQRLAEHQVKVIRDKRCRKSDVDTVDDCRELSTLYGDRIKCLESFLQEMERPQAVKADGLWSRVREIRKHREGMDALIQRLQDQQKFGSQREEQHGDWAFGQQQGQQPIIKGWTFGGDKATKRDQRQHGWNDGSNQRNDNPGWQQVGVGTWEPNKPGGDKSKPATNRGPGAGWGGKNDTNKKQEVQKSATSNHWWAAKNDQQSKQIHCSKDEDKDSKKGGFDPWGDDQSKVQNTWNGEGSKKTTVHSFGGWGDGNRSKSGKSNTGGWGENNNGGDNQNNNWDTTGNDKGQGWGNNGDASNNSSASKQQSQGNGGWRDSKPNSKAGNSWENNNQQNSRSQRSRSASGAESNAGQDHIKPYWADWIKPFNRDANAPPETKPPRAPRPVYNYSVSPLPAIPEDKAKDRSYGVQVSRGADYSHKCRKPIYIDTMESPYAVFSFKYRSREALEKILKRKIDAVDVKKIQEQAERDRLASMSKHKLVEELMKRKSSRNEPQRKSSVEKSTGWRADSDQGGGGGAGWDDSGNGNDQWGGGSNHSRRSSRQSDRKSSKTASGFDANQITNPKAGAWGASNDNGNNDDNGGGVQW